jgi:multidrug transporter EmrE-like cation transporter
MPEIINNLDPNQRIWIVIGFALVISIIESFTQVNIKKKNIACGLIGYIIIVFVLYSSYNYEGLGHMNLIWSCISIITGYILGHIFFKETINKYSICAILLAILAIYISHLSDEI